LPADRPRDEWHRGAAVLAQTFVQPDDGPARADAAHHGVHPRAGNVFGNLPCGAEAVRRRIVRVLELARLERASLLRQFLGLGECATDAARRGAEDDLAAVAPDAQRALAADPLRHHGEEA